jgi:hypothetical protein
VSFFRASPFTSQAGAKHVYGIECSAIAQQAKQIVADNGYSDRVSIVVGKVRHMWTFTVASALKRCVISALDLMV